MLFIKDGEHLSWNILTPYEDKWKQNDLVMVFKNELQVSIDQLIKAPVKGHEFNPLPRHRTEAHITVYNSASLLYQGLSVWPMDQLLTWWFDLT